MFSSSRERHNQVTPLGRRQCTGVAGSSLSSVESGSSMGTMGAGISYNDFFRALSSISARPPIGLYADDRISSLNCFERRLRKRQKQAVAVSIAVRPADPAAMLATSSCRRFVGADAAAGGCGPLSDVCFGLAHLQLQPPEPPSTPERLRPESNTTLAGLIRVPPKPRASGFNRPCVVSMVPVEENP
jgi:hypothetical protein